MHHTVRGASATGYRAPEAARRLPSAVPCAARRTTQGLHGNDSPGRCPAHGLGPISGASRRRRSVGRQRQGRERTVRRGDSTIPGPSEIALVATAALTSATLLFACVVPLPAIASRARAIRSCGVTAGSARTGAASLPRPAHAHALFAKQGAGGEPVSRTAAARPAPGGIGTGSRIAAGDRTWTPGEPSGCSLARGQPCADALT